VQVTPGTNEDLIAQSVTIAEPVLKRYAPRSRSAALPRWWPVAAIAAVYVTVGLLQLMYGFSVPTDGWRLAYHPELSATPLVFDQNLAGWPSPIREGDELVAIEGQPVSSMLGGLLTAHPSRPIEWAVGHSVRYTVNRGGVLTTFDVVVARRPLTWLLNVVRTAPIDVASLVLFGVVGTFVFIRVPRHPAAQAMLIMAADELNGLGVHSSVVGTVTPAEMLDPLAGTLRLALLVLFYSVFCSFWLHLFLVFPVVQPVLLQRPRLSIAAVYALPLLAELVALAASLGQPTRIGTNLVISLVVDVLVVLVVVLMVLRHSFRALHDQVYRAQLRLLVLALVMAFPVASLFGLANVLWFSSEPFVAGVLTLASTACFPLVIATAIVRHQLFDIEALINRAIVYACLTGLLGLAYFIALAAFQTAFRVITGQTSELAVVGSTLVSVALISPLRKGVQDFIDRSFYRRKYDTAKTLAAFGASLREIIDLNALTDQLIDVVRETMEPISVQLELPAGSMSREADAAACVDGHVVQTAREQAALGVPLITRGELVGMLNLGRRRGGHAYTVDDRNLLDGLAYQAAPALKVAQLVTQSRAEERTRASIEQELRLAHEIQLSLLPRVLPAVPGWSISAYYQPARAVGGDFYDVLQLPGGRLGFAVGDVANKGMPAALLMASVRTTIRAVAARTASPGEILQQVNEQLLPDLPHNMFVTCLVMVLEPDTGRVRMATAGHLPPLSWSASCVRELDGSGLPLGFAAVAAYDESECVLAPEQALLAYTDGLIESRDASGELLGSGRLATMLGQLDVGQPDTVIPELLTRVAQFAGRDRELDDDITILLVQRQLRTAAGA
jgi:serine phosphatase RsbU (regulator of sigma subunit)